MAYINKKGWNTPVPIAAVEMKSILVKPMITRKMTKEECIKYGVPFETISNKKSVKERINMTPVEAVQNGLSILDANVMLQSDMTKSDVEFLLSKGISKAAIKRAYGFHSDGAFYNAFKKLEVEVTADQIDPEIKEVKNGFNFKPLSMQIFVCPVCDLRHHYEEDAKNCINCHVLPAEIVNVQGYNNENLINVPLHIQVMMTDGRTVLYKFEEVVQCS